MDPYILLAGALAGFSVFAYLIVRLVKHSIGKEFKVQAVASALNMVGIKKVDAKFFNELTNEGMQRMLTTVYNVMNFQKTLNPLGATGMSKSLQDLQAIIGMGQLGAQSTGNPAT